MAFPKAQLFPAAGPAAGFNPAKQNKQLRALFVLLLLLYRKMLPFFQLLSVGKKRLLL